MSLISKLNARFGRYAVPNLTVILIAGQVFLYVAKMFNPAQGGDVLEKVRLYPAYVLDGEVWRLVTFLFDPPATNPVFAFLFWYLFYLFGTTLEQSWGAFRYNVFLAIGYVATVAMSFAVYCELRRREHSGKQRLSCTARYFWRSQGCTRISCCTFSLCCR